jgi:hypothetical protein
LSQNSDLAAKLQRLEKEVTSRLDSHEKAIVELMQQFFNILNSPPSEPPAEEPKREIGFHVKDSSESKSKRAR